MILEADEVDGAGGEILEQLDQLRAGLAEAVQPPADDRLDQALGDVLHEPVPLRPARIAAGPGVLIPTNLPPSAVRPSPQVGLALLVGPSLQVRFLRSGVAACVREAHVDGDEPTGAVVRPVGLWPGLR